MWIASENSEQVVDYLREQVSMPILPLSSDSSIDWIAITKIPLAHLHSNLIPRHIRKKRMLLWIFRGSAILILLLGLLSVFTVWKIENIINDQGTHTSEVINKLSQWQSKKDILTNKNSQLQEISERKKAFDASIISPAAPAWFAKYIAAILPDAMVLSHISIERKHQKLLDSTTDEAVLNNVWQFSIQGMLKNTRKESLPKVLKSFEAMLTSPPLKANITQSWHISWLKQIQSGNTVESNTRTFIIKGTIQ